MAHKFKGPALLHHMGKSVIIENFRVIIGKLLDEGWLHVYTIKLVIKIIYTLFNCVHVLGGFSIVYQAHAQDGKDYALKKITTNTRQEFEVYLQEINIMVNTLHFLLLMYLLTA